MGFMKDLGKYIESLFAISILLVLMILLCGMGNLESISACLQNL